MRASQEHRQVHRQVLQFAMEQKKLALLKFLDQFSRSKDE